MTLFFLTLLLMLIVVAVMAVGVAFGRDSIKGSCGGMNNGNCVCIRKCAKKRQLTASADQRTG